MVDTEKEDQVSSSEAQMSLTDLYREEIYTDRKIGVIRALIPIMADGTKDESRKTVYTGEAQIMTQMGALPINFEIEASSLEEAVKGYRDAAKEGVEKTMKELQELRRQAASKLVVPGQAGFNPPESPTGNGLIMP